ncbi:hypothetical protein [Sphingomonas koreensis]
MPAAIDEMKSRLRIDLLACMRTRQSLEAGVIRTLLAALDNAEALPANPDRPASLQARFGDESSEAARCALSREDVGAIIGAEIQQRWDAAADLERLGQPDRASILRQEVQIARRYAS